MLTLDHISDNGRTQKEWPIWYCRNIIFSMTPSFEEWWKGHIVLPLAVRPSPCAAGVSNLCLSFSSGGIHVGLNIRSYVKLDISGNISRQMQQNH